MVAVIIHWNILTLPVETENYKFPLNNILEFWDESAYMNVKLIYTESDHWSMKVSTDYSDSRGLH